MDVVYFAHSMRIYGSKEEAAILTYLDEVHGRENVVCPNNDMGELGGITPYLKRIEKCQQVDVREYKGFVGKGAYEEVRHALKLKKVVHVITGSKSGGFKRKKVTAVIVYNSKDWKVQYGKLILAE